MKKLNDANIGILVLLSTCLCLFSCNNDNDNLPKDYAGATTIIKIYPKQMVLNKQNVTLSCTPQWKEGGISKLTILLKRK